MDIIDIRIPNDPIVLRRVSEALAEMAAIVSARRVVESFRVNNTYINCSDITHLDASSSGFEQCVYFLLKGGSVGCLKMAARYAPVALNEINTGFSEVPAEVPADPVSCASIVARRSGLSDVQVAMAAGFAGGIGIRWNQL